MRLTPGRALKLSRETLFKKIIDETYARKGIETPAAASSFTSSIDETYARKGIETLITL